MKINKRIIAMVLTAVLSFPYFAISQAQAAEKSSVSSENAKTKEVFGVLVEPKLEYDSVDRFSSEGFAIVQKEGKYGVIDRNGKEVIQLQEYLILQYKSGAAIFSGDTNIGNGTGYAGRGNEGMMDSTGKIIVEAGKYQSIGYINDGLAPVASNEKCGFINTMGKEVIKPKYDGAWGFSEGLSVIKQNGKFGYIDINGKEVVKPQYTEAESLENGLAKVGLNGKYGFINKSGKEVIKPIYNITTYLGNLEYDYKEGLVPIELNGKWGYMDKSGKPVIGFKKYERVLPFSDGVAMVFAKDKSGKEVYGYIDKTGKEIITPQFSMDFGDDLDFAGWIHYPGLGSIDPSVLGRFQKGIALVHKGDKYFYINKKGKAITTKKYDSITFAEGLAKVEANGKFGYINGDGKEITKLKYSAATGFYNGYASVQLDGKWGIIDTTGKEVVPLKYDEIEAVENGYALIKQAGKWGVAGVRPKVEAVQNTQKIKEPIIDYSTRAWPGEELVLPFQGKIISSEIIYSDRPEYMIKENLNFHKMQTASAYNLIFNKTGRIIIKWTFEKQNGSNEEKLTYIKCIDKNQLIITSDVVIKSGGSYDLKFLVKPTKVIVSNPGIKYELFKEGTYDISLVDMKPGEYYLTLVYPNDVISTQQITIIE